ncbi:hypothetical protein TREAZ_0085 [Leadbettera azotonutricia ZAS-9]|uniref:Uncharacterized protein n=1 Tax=Leadbettera azotonutricia (strain ATCC BAA-888 / DSM 13862 / ZAS-9) TaxID=545695 RepID=F5YFJ2_LEAAZ|nr:hypothetical protein TREAZ_0085 [Leadbettera azotonutricia ZAS-9]
MPADLHLFLRALIFSSPSPCLFPAGSAPQYVEYLHRCFSIL